MCCGCGNCTVTVARGSFTQFLLISLKGATRGLGGGSATIHPWPGHTRNPNPRVSLKARINAWVVCTKLNTQIRPLKLSSNRICFCFPISPNNSACEKAGLFLFRRFEANGNTSGTQTWDCEAVIHHLLPFHPSRLF